ncbi:hypothetical protein CXB51_017107 [Gossypium anomalum]|uniref:Uncharacterized protein n=1 Tax=Gossypium anomalum TaxID=47600 RepID=A0A8J6CVK1_9ROSI|nr:hypothetical protein CXB51_017107 [Gossypium anomalum]
MADNSHSNFKLKRHKMYPRVKVTVQEEEEDHFPPHNNNHHEPCLFLRLLESLSKQEKENKINSPPSNSIFGITKAYITSPTPKDGGTVEKNKKQIGKDMKSNVKPSSVLPPRAVLSSPDNDRMIGSINELDYASSSSASKKRPADVGTPSSPNIGKGPKPKTENVKHTRTKIITKGGYNTDIVKPTPDSNVGKGPKAKNPGLATSTRKGVV